MLSIQLIIFLFLGWFVYWLMSCPSALRSPDNTIETVGEYFSKNAVNMVVSFIIGALPAFGGDSLPDWFGKVNSPYSAFISGMVLPSLVSKLRAMTARNITPVIIGLVFMLSISSCSQIKSIYNDLNKHCTVSTTGTFQSNYRACIVCDSLATNFKTFSTQKAKHAR